MGENRFYEKLMDSFFVIAGPCVIEEEGLTLEIAEEIARISSALKIPFIFKAS
ncbi:MAG: 3-deoxy-8-phosphooctulonate synthase, partial [Desulfatiglandales bacterium]